MLLWVSRIFIIKDSVFSDAIFHFQDPIRGFGARQRPLRFSSAPYSDGQRGITGHPGKPTDNTFTGSFNDTFRGARLCENWFLSLANARDKIKPQEASN
jgi:hypothetical protein